MSNNKLLNYQNINTDKYEYLEPVKASNCYMSSCVYNLDGSNRLPYYFQTPRLHTPTGIYKIRNEYKMDIIIPVDSPFLEYLINEDDKNIQITSDNSEEWFDEHFTNQEVSDKYKTSLIFRQGGEDPILRVNIPSYRGNPKCEVFDVKGKECDWSVVQPESQLIGILEKIGIKFYKEVLTGEYELHKIKVYNHAEQSKLPKGYLFQDEESEDESDSENNDDDNDDDNDDNEDDIKNTEEEDAMLRELRGDDDSDDSEDNDEDSDLEDLEGLEELDLTDLSDAEDDNTIEDNDDTEMNELTSLENDLKEISMDGDDGDGDGDSDDNDNYNDDDDSDEEEIITLEEVNTIPARNLDTFDDLNDDMLNLDNKDTVDDSDEEEIIDVPDELLSDMEQELEGGHEEELQEDGEADIFQIDELTDDELDLNLSDNESELEQEQEQEQEQYFESDYPELDGIDLSDLEETDLRTEIQSDITKKNNSIEPEELTDEELELDF